MKKCLLALLALCFCGNLLASAPLQILSAVARNNGCNDPQRGSIAVTISGGVAPYVYSVCYNFDPAGGCDTIQASPSTNALEYTFTNLFVQQTGFSSFFVFVSDSAGSSVQFPRSLIGIQFPGVAAVTFNVASASPACVGGNGSIIVTADGGNGLYSVSLNGGAFTPPAASPVTIPAAPGTYTVDVQDSSGCPQPPSQQVTVNQSTATPVTFTASATNALCHDTNGTIAISAQGGSGLYTFSLDGGPFFPAFQASPFSFPAPPATYTVAVQDSNGCSGGQLQTITILNPAPVTFAFTTSGSCKGLPNGSISVTSASGGSGKGYTASLNDGPFLQIPITFSNVAGGTYSVIAQDSQGCQSDTGRIIVPSSTPITSIFAVKKVTMNGGTDGAISVKQMYGGTGPFTWDIGTGVTQSTAVPFTGLAADVYTVTVTDSNGCLVPFQQVFVTEPESPEIVEVISTNATIIPPAVIPPAFTLFAAARKNVAEKPAEPQELSSLQAVPTLPNGSLRIIADSRTSLQYSINGLAGPFQDSPLFTGLVAGTYQLAVRPRPDCTGAQAIGCGVVGAVAALHATATITPADCATGGLGSITVLVSGGTAPFLYSLNGGDFQGSPVFNNVKSGTYTISVLDADGHTATIPVAVPSVRTPTGNLLVDFIGSQFCEGCVA